MTPREPFKIGQIVKIAFDNIKEYNLKLKEFVKISMDASGYNGDIGIIHDVFENPFGTKMTMYHVKARSHSDAQLYVKPFLECVIVPTTYDKDDFNIISRDILLNNIYKTFPQTKTDDTFQQYVQSAEHQDGYTFWNRFRNVKETIVDFKITHPYVHYLN